MFWFSKKAAGDAADMAALKGQLESAKRRITELLLENIQLANDIQMLEEHRDLPMASAPRPVLAIGKNMAMLAEPANSEIGLLRHRAAS